MARLEQPKNIKTQELNEIKAESCIDFATLVSRETKFGSKDCGLAKATQQEPKEGIVELAGWVHYCMSPTPGIAAGTSSRFCGEYYVEPRRKKK